MQNFENHSSYSKSLQEAQEIPKIGCTFFNSSVSLCISLPYNSSTLKDIINREFKEYIKIDGNTSSIYYSLGVILTQEILTTSKNMIRYQNAIEKLTNSVNCRMLYSSYNLSALENFSKRYLNSIKYLQNIIRSNKQISILEDRKKMTSKVILDELKKSKEFMVSLIQTIRSAIYSYIIGKNDPKRESIATRIRENMWDLHKQDEIAFIKYFSECFDIPITIMNLTDSNYEILSEGEFEMMSSKYYFLNISGKKNFKGIVFPNRISELENIPDELSTFKNSTCSTIKYDDEFETQCSKSAKKQTFRQNDELAEVKKRVVFDEIVNEKEGSQKIKIISQCSLCGSDPNEDLITTNPGCEHNYCIGCLMSVAKNNMTKCFVSSCRHGLDKTKIIEFLLNRQSREGDVTFNFQSSHKFEKIRDTPRISDDPGFIKLNVDIITCPISNQKYNSRDNLPRMLPCGHTLSQKTLIKILDNSKSTDFKCPFDKKNFVKSRIEDFVVNASLLDIIIEVEKSQENLDSMKNKLKLCLGQIDNWIDSSLDIQKKEKDHFVKEVDSKFNELIELINKKKEEIAIRIQSEFEVSKRLNKEDEDILHSLRRRFEGEIECIEELKQGYFQVSETGRYGFESSLVKIQETFENAKNEPQKFYDYYFKSCIIDAIYKLLNEGTVFIGEDGKNRFIQF